MHTHALAPVGTSDPVTTADMITGLENSGTALQPSSRQLEDQQAPWLDNGEVVNNCLQQQNGVVMLTRSRIQSDTDA